MTTAHERCSPATREVRADLPTETVDSETVVVLEDFAACVLASRASEVVSALDRLDLEVVALFGRSTAQILAAALVLAGRNIDPTPTLVFDELQRTGQVGDGHHGQLVRTSLLDLITNHQPAERLRPLSAALAAELHRSRGVTAGEAIAAAYRNLSESDAYAMLRREGAAVRRAHDTVTFLREGLNK